MIQNTGQLSIDVEHIAKLALYKFGDGDDDSHC